MWEIVEKTISDDVVRVAVISDIHANSLALKACLVQVKALKVDQLVILGDLLTYGVDVNETIDLVCAEVDNGAVAVMGNHDKMYLGLAGGQADYYDKLPDWLRESVALTYEKLNLNQFEHIPWQQEYERGKVLMAHANPFGSGDWTYLNSEHEISRARTTLELRGFDVGVFGHTHRAFLDSNGTKPWLANPGSLGQPRSPEKESTFLTIELEGSNHSGEIHQIGYREEDHVLSLLRSELSESTKQKLVGYFASSS